jgi:cyclin-dependent kinase 7
VLGTPSDENWPDHKALPLPSRGLLWDDCPPIPFNEIFTAAPKDAISLLRSMLGRLTAVFLLPPSSCFQSF